MISMSLEDFVKEIVEDNKEEIDEIRELVKILEQIVPCEYVQYYIYFTVNE